MKPVIALCALSLLAACAPAPEPTDTAPRPVLVTQPASSQALREVYSGEVRARYEPALGFRVPGKITRLLVDVGDSVRAGQPLAELSDDDFLLQRKAAEARLAAARADRDLAQSELERFQPLLGRQVISQSQYDAVESRSRAAEAVLEQAQADVRVARNQAGYATLRADQDGVIAARQAEEGQVVSAGQVVFVLATEGEREVRIHVPENDVARVKVQQPVEVSLWTRPEARYPAHVRQVAPVADRASRTYELRIALDQAVPGIEVGQSARVFLSSQREGGTMTVPLSALSAERDQPFVWRVTPEQVLEQVFVAVGPYLDDRVPVLSGLAADDWIVAAGGHLLVAGQAVRAVDRNNRTVTPGHGE